MLYAFELGREWKLSLAELESIFGIGSIQRSTKTLALVESSVEVTRIFGQLGWVVRAFRVIEKMRDPKDFPRLVLALARDFPMEERVTFGLGAFGSVGADDKPLQMPLFQMGLRLKKDWKAKWHSIRLVNKDDKNLVSAVVKKEHLARDAREYALLSLEGEYYLAATIAIQDIDAYSARDLGKTRDMQVGMLPPKLAQTMINLALGAVSPSEARVYDPFCGLGTVLIESIQMGASRVYGSDIEPAMTEATGKSVSEYLPVIGSEATSQIETLDARRIDQFSQFSDVTHIVTEGYLGRVFTKGTMTPDAVKIEKSRLLDIYRSMFDALRKSAFSGTIVISIPCWEVPRDAIYFSEFFEVLRNERFESIPLIQGLPSLKLTKYGTLVYRRPDQLVGREIVKIRSLG